jgi:hypothetical protein
MHCALCMKASTRFLTIHMERIWVCQRHYDDFHYGGLIEVLVIDQRAVLRAIPPNPEEVSALEKGLALR